MECQNEFSLVPGSGAAREGVIGSGGGNGYVYWMDNQLFKLIIHVAGVSRV